MVGELKVAGVALADQHRRALASRLRISWAKKNAPLEGSIRRRDSSTL
jgi:hypothetical protein